MVPKEDDDGTPTQGNVPTDLTQDAHTERQSLLYAYWDRLCPGPNRLPLKDDFEPTAIPKILSSLVIADLRGNDVQFRLVGTDMVNFWGGDFTGQTLSEVMEGDYRDYIRKLFDTCAEARRPVLSRSRFRWDKDRAANTVRLMVPFADAASPERVAYVMVCQTFDYDRENAVEQPTLKVLRDGTNFQSVHSDEGTEVLNAVRR